MNIGDSKVILGYPWMAVIQPRIDWKHGWIDHEHLPLVFYIPKHHRGTFIHKKSISEMTMADPSPLSGLPPTYRHQWEEGDRLLIGRIAVETTDDPLDKISLPY